MCRTFSAHVIHRFTRLCRDLLMLYEGRPASQMLGFSVFFSQEGWRQIILLNTVSWSNTFPITILTGGRLLYIIFIYEYITVLRIRDVYPRSRILIFTRPGSWIPDPGSNNNKKRGVNKICCLTCCGSMSFYCGSGSGSGSADPCMWLLDPDPAIFVTDLQDANKKLMWSKSFSAYYGTFWRYLYIIFQRENKY